MARGANVGALRELLAELEAGQAVEVWGMGGTGKSTIATAVVHDPAVRELFTDGIVWERVGRIPGLAGLLGRVLTAFGDVARVVDAAEGVRRLRRMLVGARCLIVLDDVWDIAVVNAFQPPAGVRILVTSRTRQAWYADAGGHELAMADENLSRRVLAAHAGRAVDELPPVAGEIVRRCGGLIQALALAGSMVRLGTRSSTGQSPGHGSWPRWRRIFRPPSSNLPSPRQWRPPSATGKADGLSRWLISALLRVRRWWP
ncbi:MULTISPECIES: NB-ARC domain-containing protein [unclassified Pseudofrankia]|uniref:NB-ARC domain-containing protein n=1 Tax=unclassified Pseudofrankia TaxID=2994372 RepID=UPI0008D9D748|nr:MULTISPECIES: NB-ARC domain-containing protein [unclassified Pseudofrankia]MDT3440697.1 NB-ARC domain-containing protein [Pseudofrankia sp. BMG5.37]OHV58905.1 hypothetical protein BCD48_05675 [Pseudofrankia sp. BMG5.36]